MSETRQDERTEQGRCLVCGEPQEECACEEWRGLDGGDDEE